MYMSVRQWTDISLTVSVMLIGVKCCVMMMMMMVVVVQLYCMCRTTLLPFWW